MRYNFEVPLPLIHEPGVQVPERFTRQIQFYCTSHILQRNIMPQCVAADARYDMVHGYIGFRLEGL